MICVFVMYKIYTLVKCKPRVIHAVLLVWVAEVLHNPEKGIQEMKIPFYGRPGHFYLPAQIQCAGRFQ